MESLYGNFRQVTFSDVFSSYEQFNAEKEACEIPIDIENAQMMTLYYLLYSRYANSTIASSDTNRFKYDLFSIIFSYGPTWSKKLLLQQQIRNLTEDELLKGGSAIYNTALNPSTAPSTQSTEELNYINSQNTTKYKKSKAEALTLQYSLLEDTVTEEFLNKFKRLFLTVVAPEKPLWYETIDNDNLEE